jgi:hypothetical protein
MSRFFTIQIAWGMKRHKPLNEWPSAERQFLKPKIGLLLPPKASSPFIRKRPEIRPLFYSPPHQPISETADGQQDHWLFSIPWQPAYIQANSFTI